jgi:hypothetical protein
MLPDDWKLVAAFTGTRTLKTVQWITARRILALLKGMQLLV